MLKKTKQAIHALRTNSRGNAAMLAALGMPMLIGGAGLAVDTAQWFMWKRELQHSADQAAIGAAWALSNENLKDDYKKRAYQEFDANQAVTADFTAKPGVRLANYASGTDNSVIVTAEAKKKLPFSSLLMTSGAVIRVRAQASYKDGFDFNACLVALAEDSSVLDIGGNASVSANCGLAALSCEKDAVVISGSAKVSTESIATCGTVSVPGENEDVVSENVKGLKDIYADLTPPNNPTPRSVTCVGNGKNSAAALLPGTYKGGLVAKCSTVLAPGIYVIDGGELDLAGNFDVLGTNVMFVLKNGARIKLGGNGKGNKITLTPMQEADFLGTPYADQADKLQGMLIFEDRNNNPKEPGHTLNGNSNSLIEGLIYLPSGEIRINGTADVASQCLQISAYKIKVLGNANLETLCPTKDSTHVGKSVAEVRLVA